MDKLEAAVIIGFVLLVAVIAFGLLSIAVPGEEVCTKLDSSGFEGDYWEWAEDIENCEREASIFSLPYILSFVLLIITSIAIVILATLEVIESKKPAWKKLFWIIVIWALFGVLGAVAYYYFGRESK